MVERTYQNIPRHKYFRKKLRRDATQSEKLLWSKLRRNQLGVKFRRQFGIGPYIVDFYCHEAKLIVELDGISHADDRVRMRDRAREQWLNENRYIILRFTDIQIQQNLVGCIHVIQQHIP